MITIESKARPIWYRGWEIIFSADAAYWTGEGWLAYKGGCDIDAPSLSAPSFVEIHSMIDDEVAA